MSGLSRRQWLQGGLAVGGLSVLAGCGLLPLAGSRPSHLPRVGWLSPANGPDSRELTALRQGLSELGYVEGQNISIEPRVANGDNQRLPALAAELVSLAADVIVTDGPLAAAAARDTTHTLPIVMGISGSDPVGNGLVASLDRPGGNITGFSATIPAMFAKRLQLLKEAVPSVARVAALNELGRPASVLSETQAAAPALGLELVILNLASLDELEGTFDAVMAAHADGLLEMGGPRVASARRRVVALALERRLPGVYPDRGFAAEGGLLAYGSNVPDIFCRSAIYVDKVLKGARPGDLPVQQPTTFDFAINLKTAQALGVTMPPGVLAQATEVLQ